MSSANKRHQARNEQALQDLLRSVPGNDRCADCQARNPGWASWSLGIFLCVRCGSLHRKLGTHISKVKSLSMDAWAADQHMRLVGNVKSNQKFNPSNTKPPIPLDADEIDAAMERFIRAKYDQKSYMAGAPHPTRSFTMPASLAQSPSEIAHARSVEHSPLPEDPPTPPPKSSRKFGLSFRSASSTFGRKKDRSDPSRAVSGAAAPGKVISAAFGVTDEGMEWKLVQLREMGFPDDNRNSSVLKGVNGDLERAIESLVRLGEGAGAVRRPLQPSRDAVSNDTAFSANGRDSPRPVAQVQNNLQAASRNQTQSSTQSPSQAEDFWDNLATPAKTSASPQSFEAAFQNMQIAQSAPQQPQPPSLFPNLTGGIPQQSSVNQIYGTNAPYQQSMTPPVPQMPHQFATNPYSPTLNHNPFVASPVQQSPVTTSNPFMNMQPSSPSSNPFLSQGAALNNQQAVQSPQAQIFAQQGGQQIGQQQQQPWQAQSVQSQGSYFANQNFGAPPTQQQPPQQQQPYQQPAFQQSNGQPSWNPYQQQQQVQQNPYAAQQFQSMAPQPTGRIDKSSIMALYSQPQLAPQYQASQAGEGMGSAPPQQPPQPVQMASQHAPPQRSVTMPLTNSKNPFAAMSSPGPVQGSGGYDMNGRHSPDAFASLSSRSVL